ncbi:bifunctional deaminase-reductase domain protein [Thalassoporum mexicanum PCC 7367]|uniref:dihydrofolate reductase family protein n=1 Tax=Thalassoporum mexicanum TaxID=3457544 RepID=UPI00029F81D4|nr:dihydrofolate reductase family protein [Pseudanabaena sp. PCC 7367]AFY70244.1 bifunctional deaminase-reductase domain protein [Pseudanabaena sp. PCC 7367]
MSLKASVFIATSLDGFIAREDGSIDWLNVANAVVPEGEDCGYASFMDSVDVLVMGRNSYEKVLSFGAWPYQDKQVIVLSSRALEIPNDLSSNVVHSAETPAALHQRLANQGFKHIYIDGGITIQRFLAAGLIDDITITVIPMLIGQGKSLFGELEQDILLKHIKTKAYDFGFVQSTYELVKNM